MLGWTYSVRLIHPFPSVALSAAFKEWIGKLAEVLQTERKKSLK